VSVRLSAALGVGLWPSRWPLAAQLAIAFPIAELPVYWFHRLEHRGGFLWRIHAVHHSAPRLYFLNSARNHPIDAVLSLALLVAPLVLLGAGERLLAVAMVVWAVHALLQHANVDVRLGPLNWILSMAEVHRWHHSRRIDEANANYGQTLLLWDIVFGTRRVPRREPPEDVGLPDLPAYPTGWLGQVASPFDGQLWRSELPPGEERSSPEP
jgi:sterol desaturase/sphingolipid hydroxylase (fatty acid hydroxylase superfamily)